MPRPRPRALLWAALAVAASAGAPLLSGGAFDRLALGIEATGLRFDPTSLDFGEAYSGAPVACEFAVENATSRPVRILEAASPCACVQVEATPRYVEPRGRAVLRARFVTDGRFGPQTIRVRVRTDEGERAGALLTIRGRLRAALLPRPHHIHLGAVAPGSEHVREIRVEKVEPATAFALSCRGEGLSAAIAAEDARGLSIRATVRAPWRTGAAFGGIALAFLAGGTPRELWIPVAWSVPPPFEVTPEELRIAEGSGEVAVRVRYGTLAGIDTRGLPLAVAREERPGGHVLLHFALEGSALDIPSGAAIDLLAEPAELGPVAIPVYVEER